MKGFAKGLSPSISNSDRNLPSSGSVENDENESSGDKLIPRSSSNKTPYGKHFMSGVPRKKVLAEIKGIPKASDAQAHENSNLDLEKSPPKKGVCDSSVKVYDPLTNYLSPRPRYLRFNPNRRREIFKRLEKELSTSLDSEETSDEEEIADSSLSPLKGSDNGNVFDGYKAEEEEIVEIADSSRSPPKGSDVNQRNGGVSGEDNGNAVDGYEAEAEEEEGMEERGWCLRGLLKLLLTLIACLLLNSYMFPMNSPTQQAIWDFKDSGLVIKNQTLEYVSINLSGSGFFEVEDGGNNGIKEVEVEEESYCETDESIEAEIVEYLEWNEREMVRNENVDSEDNSIEEVEVEEEKYGESDESIEADIIEYLEWHEREMVGNENVDSEDNSIEEEEVEEENYGESDESIEADVIEYLEWSEKEMFENEDDVDREDIVDEAAEFEGVRDARFELKADESEHLIDANTDENLGGAILLDMEVVSSSYTGLEEDNVSKDEAAEWEIIGGGVVTCEAQSSGHLIGPETVESEDDSAYMLEMGTHSSNLLQGPLGPVLEEILKKSKGVDETGSLEELVGSHEELSDSMDEVDDIGDDDYDDAEVGMEKSGWNAVVVVSAVIFSVSTSLAIVYHSRNSRRGTSSKESEPALKQKLAVEGNVNPVLLPSIDRKVEFLPRASLPSHSMREAPRELASHIHAPTVELIGEIVVGQPRNTGKFQMIVSEDECNAATLSRKRGARPQVVPASSQSSAVELHPSVSSTSSGSFTTERKSSKKEGGQSREAMIGTTPVRRSSRLRNRPAVLSP